MLMEVLAVYVDGSHDHDQVGGGMLELEAALEMRRLQASLAGRGACGCACLRGAWGIAD